jgi:putative flippase GtrA
MKKAVIFFSFTAVSGIGWFFDLLIYYFLSIYFRLDASLSNFISSYIGITFVWFFSLKLIFKKEDSSQSTIWKYWIYQFFSIFLYSYLLRLVFIYLVSFDITYFEKKLFAKLLVTPLNLATNFLFISFLVKSIKK